MIFWVLFIEDFWRSCWKFEDVFIKWFYLFFLRSIYVNNVVDIFNMWNNFDLMSV